MKKLALIAAAILIAVIAGLLVIRDRGPKLDVTADTTYVGLILNGSRQDENYCQSHYEALEFLCDELNLKIVCRDYMPADESCRACIDEMIAKNRCRMIIAVSDEFGDIMAEAANAYPEICFLQASGTERSANLSSYFGRMYQARYLAGIVAGMKTATGEIGYIASTPGPETIRGINAFALGVRSVAPDAGVHVKYTGSWTEDAAAQEATRKLLDAYPVDVIGVHVNSLKPHEEADVRGVYSIGCNLDNAERFPDTWLTATVWHWEGYYREQILNCLKDKFYGRNDWISMLDGIAGISGLTDNAAEGSDEAVRMAGERLAERTWDVFYGPITDNAGNLRVESGESMSDDELLNRIDWYVEGVSIED